MCIRDRFNIVLEFLERNLIRRTLRSMRSKGYNQKHILLVGYSLSLIHILWFT